MLARKTLNTINSNLALDATLTRRRLIRSGSVLTTGALTGALPGLSAGAAESSTGPDAAFAVRSAQQVSGNVSMWVFPLATSGEATDVEMWQEIVSDFRGKYPDIDVDVQVLPWEGREDKLTTAVASGATPDVSYFNDDYIPTYGNGFLEPLDDLISDDSTDFLDNMTSNLSLDGVLYAMPILATVTSLVYNHKLFQQLGISDLPTTWDDILEVGPVFRDAESYVTSYAGSVEGAANLSFYPLLWQAGGEVLSEDGTEAAFNSPEGLEALNFVVKLFEEEFVNRDEAVNPSPGTSSFLEGQVGCNMFGHNFLTTQLADTLGGEEFVEVGPPLKHEVRTSYGTTAGFGVFKTAQDMDAAKAWVKFITSAEPMKTILRSGGYLPPRASLQDLYANDPFLNEAVQYIPLMHGGVRHPQATQLQFLILPHVQAAFLGQVSPEEALASAEAEVNRLIG